MTYETNRHWRSQPRLTGAEFDKLLTDFDEALKKIREKSNALEGIFALMDGQEWSSDTLEEIAEILRHVGYKVREPDHG